MSQQFDAFNRINTQRNKIRIFIIKSYYFIEIPYTYLVYKIN